LTSISDNLIGNGHSIHSGILRNLREFIKTEIELKLIVNPASSGDKKPKAANGMLNKL
jgi:hypothetical protein